MSNARRKWYLWGLPLAAAGVMSILLIVYHFFVGGVSDYNVQWTIFTEKPLTVSRWWDVLAAAVVTALFYWPVVIEEKILEKGSEVKIGRTLLTVFYCMMMTSLFSFVIFVLALVDKDLMLFGPLLSLIIFSQIMSVTAVLAIIAERVVSSLTSAWRNRFITI